MDAYDEAYHAHKFYEDQDPGDQAPTRAEVESITTRADLRNWLGLPDITLDKVRATHLLFAIQEEFEPDCPPENAWALKFSLARIRHQAAESKHLQRRIDLYLAISGLSPEGPTPV